MKDDFDNHLLFDAAVFDLEQDVATLIFPFVCVSSI